MLFLLPFVVVGIVLFRFWINGEYTPCTSDGLISLPFLGIYQDDLWLWSGGIFLLLFLAFFLFFIADRYKFLTHTTVLPSVFYALLVVGDLCRYGVNAYLFAALAVAMAVVCLQSAIIHFKSNSPVFNFGFFIGLSVLLCPDLIALVLWAIFVIPLSGRATLKDLIALLLGFVVVAFFTWGYYFLVDDSEDLFMTFWNKVMEGELYTGIILSNFPAFIILGVLLFVSCCNILINYPTVVVAQRRGLLSMLSMLLFFGGSVFLIPFSCPGRIYILGIPLVYLFSQYFISHHNKWMGNILFLSFLVACGFLIFA